MTTPVEPFDLSEMDRIFAETDASLRSAYQQLKELRRHLQKQTNFNCDGSKCTSSSGEVRKYPLGGGANLYLCQACFANENRYRVERGRETGRPQDWPVIDWNTAEPLY